MHRSICDFLLDIVQNSFEADAPTVDVSIEEDARHFTCTVADTGKGMDGKMLDQVRDPFRTGGAKHPGRPVCLGIPFLWETMRRTGGRLSLSSRPGEGTTVRFVCNLRHVDTPPTGDIPGTLLLMMSDSRAGEVSVSRTLTSSRGSGSYRITKEMLVRDLGDLRKSGALFRARSLLRLKENELEPLREERQLVLTKE